MFLTLLLLWSGVNLTACSRAPQYSLVGKWNMIADNGYGANTLDFNKDGKFLQSTLMMDVGQVFIEGNYTLDSDVLTLTPSKATAVNPQFQAQVQAVGMQTSKVHLQWEHFGLVRFVVNGAKAAELHKLQ